MITQFYRLIMDPQVNALRAVRPVQKFQIMTYLSMMWTAIFCAASGAYIWFGELVLGHVILLTGILVTSVVFNRSSANRSHASVKKYRDYSRADGTATSVDFWGS